MLKNIVFLLFIIIVACSPKSSNSIVVDNTPTVVEEKDVPCPGFQHIKGYDRERAETAFVLYKDYHGQKQFDTALPHWRLAYSLAPGSNGRVKSHFEDGVDLYAYLINKTSDTILQKKYMDTIRQIFDKREICFPANAQYFGQKGFDYYYQLRDFVDRDEIYETFKKSIKVGNNNVQYFIINPFTRLLYDKVNDGSVDHKEASYYANLVYSTIQNGLATCKGKSCDSWNIINDYVPKLLASFEGIDSFYDCEYYTNKYTKVYQSDSDNCDIINKSLSRLLRGGCSDTLAIVQTIKAAKEEKCYTPPPPPGLLRQGYDAYTNGDYTKAIKHFEQYVDENDDVEKKAKYLMLIAKIYYGDIRNYPKSRQYARKAASIKSSWGDPYILIGKLYASSGPICGPGRGFESQKVTWPAIDMFQYAKKIDPNVTKEANKWISTYSAFMPSKEDLHQRTIKEGSSFYVGCWIKENTIVRAAK